MPSYRIVIDTKSQTRKEKEKEQLENVSNGSGKENKDDDGSVVTTKSYAVSKAIELAKTTALQVGKLYVDTIGVRTDNTARQNQVNNIMDLAGKGISLAESLANAIILGGKKGAVSAIVAAVTFAVTEAVNTAGNVMQYKRDIAEDTASTMHASERLGMVATDRNRRR